MTRDQFDRATELDKEIQKYTNLLSEIRGGLLTKIAKDKAAKKRLEKRSDDHNAKWTLLRFFKLRLEKKKVIAVPHYEFAHGIELDADPDLIAVILDYLEKKKKDYEAEFERTGEDGKEG